MVAAGALIDSRFEAQPPFPPAGAVAKSPYVVSARGVLHKRPTAGYILNYRRKKDEVEPEFFGDIVRRKLCQFVASEACMAPKLRPPAPGINGPSYPMTLALDSGRHCQPMRRIGESSNDVILHSENPYSLFHWVHYDFILGQN